MSYGIQCINESGFTQIDATFDNVAVFASGTMSSSFVGGTVTKTSIPANRMQQKTTGRHANKKRHKKTRTRTKEGMDR